MWPDVSKILQLFVYHEKEPLIFSSGLFLFLFFGFIIVYQSVKKNLTIKTIWVTLFSFYFYYKSSGIYFLLLALVSIFDFILGNLISKQEKKGMKKLLVFISISFHITLLSYFKYFNFFAEMITDLSGHPFEFRKIFLPVGISFYTFQSMSYIIDIYRAKIQPIKNYLHYTFFVSFFPQLVAGPIVRAADFIPQIYKPNIVTKAMFGRAVFLLMTGLIKKAIISDYISLNFVDRIFDNPALYTGFENLMGVYGYALQIYCDFSGYSDMAIGIALLMGFEFRENFRSPYLSATITEFWRRWHISLSSWLKDYLYISLGGNRKGKVRTYINLFITMLIGGLWHGASLKFILWGALHGAGLAIHKLLLGIFPKMQTTGETMPLGRRIAGIIFTFNLVSLGWIFFRADSFDSALLVLKQILTSFHPEIIPEFIAGYKYVFMLMIAGFITHFIPAKLKQQVAERTGNMPVWAQALVITAIIVFIFQIKSSEIQPFIYFQF